MGGAIEMNIGSFSVSREVLAGALVIAAILVLAVTESIDGELALLAILGVAGALGVYQGNRRLNNE